VSEHTQAQRRNAGIKEYLWAIVLAGYAIYFAYLITFNKLEDLVSPRMTVFVVLGFIALLVLLGAQVAQLVRRDIHTPRSGGFLLFLVPFAFIPLALNTNSALLSVNRGISLEQGGPRIDLTTKLHAAVNPFLPAPKPKPASSDGAIPVEGPIVFDQKNYYQAYQELYDNPDAFAGRTVEATGFVYHDSAGPKDRFIMARELMWCCAADAVVIGFDTQYSQATGLSAQEWVSVQGTLSTTSYVDPYTQLETKIPLIKVTSIEPLKGPDFAFVYPK